MVVIFSKLSHPLCSSITRILTRSINSCSHSRNLFNSPVPLGKPRIKIFKHNNNLIFLSAFHNKPFATPKTIAKFHQQDGLNPKRYTLIYKSDFQTYLVCAQIGFTLAVGAFLVTLVGAAFESQMSDEEIAQRKKEHDAAFIAQENKRREGFTSHGLGSGNPALKKLKEGEVPSTPSLMDSISEDKEAFGVMLVLLVSLTVSMFMLMRMLPIRIYVGQKDHCVGIYYGSLIPGFRSKQEFLAGTLRPHKSSWGKGEVAYNDGSGRAMVLFEKFFRKPADFNYLRGISREFDHEGMEDEMSVMKQSGDIGSRKPKSKP